MRSLRTGLVLAAALFAVDGDPGWATPGSGSMTRGPSEGELRLELRNDGGSSDIAADIDFPEGTTVTSASFASASAFQAGTSGNCSTSSSSPRRVQCFFDPPGWPAGGTIFINVVTSPPLPDDTPAQLYTCGVPCDPSAKSGPYTVSGPKSGPRADLGVSVVLEPYLERTGIRGDDYVAYDIVPGRQGGWIASFTAYLTNHGPSLADGPSLKVATAEAPEGSKVGPGIGFFKPTGVGGECQLGERTFLPAPALCSLSALPKDGEASASIGVTIKRAGTIRVEADATSATPDPGPMPNTAAEEVTFEEVPESDDGALRRKRVLTGEASGATNVDAAIGFLRGLAKLGDPSSGSRSHADSSAAAAATGCRWLTSKRVRFRFERGRRCDEPSYIRARVRKGKWSIRLRRALPRGRYVLITRAIAANGLVETAVGKKLGNLKQLRVR